MNHKLRTPPEQRDNGRPTHGTDTYKSKATLDDPPTTPTPRAHLEGTPAAGVTVRSSGALGRPIAIAVVAAEGIDAFGPADATERRRRKQCCEGERSPSLLPRCSTSVRPTALKHTNASEGATASHGSQTGTPSTTAGSAQQDI